MISVKNFTAKTKAGKTLVNALSFSLPQAQVLGVYGPNGSGKSTLLRALAGVSKQHELGGEIEVARFPIESLKNPAERVQKILYLGSDFQTPFDLSVRELFQMGADTGKKSRGEVSEITESFGLASFLDRQFRSLSDGEKQLVMFARVMIQAPLITILDESFSKLDLDKMILVTKLIRQATSKGMTFVLAAHDLNFLSEVADELLLIKNGTFIGCGPIEGLLTQSTLESLYPDLALQLVRSPETGKIKVLY